MLLKNKLLALEDDLVLRVMSHCSVVYVMSCFRWRIVKGENFE